MPTMIYNLSLHKCGKVRDYECKRGYDEVNPMEACTSRNYAKKNRNRSPKAVLNFDHPSLQMFSSYGYNFKFCRACDTTLERHF